ncbi:LORF1 protein, partial [Crocuta crocuta]
MMKQKNSPIKKFQEEVTGKKLIKTVMSNITGQDFRTTVIKLIAGPETGMEDIREPIATKIMDPKNSCNEFKNAINEVYNKMEVATAWIEEEERRIGELEDKIIDREEAKKKRDILIQEHEWRFQELSDAMKRNNILIIGILEEERKKGAEDILEQITAEHFPNLEKERDIEIQEAHRIP